jgi:hypothetical protein
MCNYEKNKKTTFNKRVSVTVCGLRMGCGDMLLTPVFCVFVCECKEFLVLRYVLYFSL